MAFEFYFREDGGGPIGNFGESYYLFPTPLYNFFGVAF